jgi:hypothetical protein
MKNTLFYDKKFLQSVNRPLAKVLFINLLDGQDAHPTRKNNSCGMGILPVLVILARGLIVLTANAVFITVDF